MSTFMDREADGRSVILVGIDFLGDIDGCPTGG